VVLHAVVLYGALFTPAGLDLGFFHALSLATWVIVALMLVLSIAQPVDNLGIGLFPLAAIALLADLALGNAQPGPLITGAGIESHVLVSLVAWAVLGLAAMQAIVVGIQHRRLHRKLPTGAVRALPPLYVMETLLFRMIGIGFALLTLALLTGFVYLEDMFAQDVAHKTALSLLAWIMFGTLLGGHHAWGWRGPTAVRFTTGGFALLVLGYFGSKLVLELILARP
jgi:ABC-type uncharacterized transport system permease subunit